jgi:hypothetical protein
VKAYIRTAALIWAASRALALWPLVETVTCVRDWGGKLFHT